MPIPTEKKKNKFFWVFPVIVTLVLIYAASLFMSTLGKEIQKLSQALTIGQPSDK
jgi:hypothetical protein